MFGDGYKSTKLCTVQCQNQETCRHKKHITVMYFKSTKNLKAKQKTRIFMTCIFFSLYRIATKNSTFISSRVAVKTEHLVTFTFPTGFSQPKTNKKTTDKNKIKYKNITFSGVLMSIDITLLQEKSQIDYTVIEAFCEVMLAATVTQRLYSVQYHRVGSIMWGGNGRNVSTCDPADRAGVFSDDEKQQQTRRADRH